MSNYKVESNYRSAANLPMREICNLLHTGEIVQAVALSYNEEEQHLRFILAGQEVYMQYNEACWALPGVTVNYAATMRNRVGKPTCFKVIAVEEVDGNAIPIISRKAAQEECYKKYISQLTPGDIIPAQINQQKAFGSFVDLGCGIEGLLPVYCTCMGRIKTPEEVFRSGEQISCVVKSFDEFGRLILSTRELLGTWEENVASFHESDTVIGVVSTVADYGAFISLTPNLSGLADIPENFECTMGQRVLCTIKGINKEKFKVKLTILNEVEDTGVRILSPKFYITEGHIDRWVYSSSKTGKVISTDFSATA